MLGGIGVLVLLLGLILLTCMDQDDARHNFGHEGGILLICRGSHYIEMHLNAERCLASCSGFICPFVPLLPVTCILINMYLLVNLRWVIHQLVNDHEMSMNRSWLTIIEATKACVRLSELSRSISRHSYIKPKSIYVARFNAPMYLSSASFCYAVPQLGHWSQYGWCWRCLCTFATDARGAHWSMQFTCLLLMLMRSMRRPVPPIATQWSDTLVEGYFSNYDIWYTWRAFQISSIGREISYHMLVVLFAIYCT